MVWLRRLGWKCETGRVIFRPVIGRELGICFKESAYPVVAVSVLADRGSSQRDGKSKYAALARDTLDPDPAAVGFYQVPDNS
jgi:hypothetical protein